MIRITTLLWVVLLVIAGGTVMHVSYQVRHVEQRLSELNRDTRLEQDKLRILGAEWTDTACNDSMGVLGVPGTLRTASILHMRCTPYRPRQRLERAKPHID